MAFMNNSLLCIEKAGNRLGEYEHLLGMHEYLDYVMRTAPYTCEYNAL